MPRRKRAGVRDVNERLRLGIDLRRPLAADPLSIRGFLAGIALPVFVALATSDQSHHLAAAIVVAVFTLGMAIVARRAHLTLVDHL